jgi:small-conductance mechanosensitive channel
MTYAEQAHGIQNKPIEARARMQMSSSSSCSSMSSSDDILGDVSTRTFIEMEQKLKYYQSQCSEAQAALAKKHLQMSEITKRAENAEILVKDTTRKLSQINKKLNTCEKNIHDFQLNTMSLTLQLKQKNGIIKSREKTEQLLSTEANQLIAALNSLTERSNSDYDELVAMHERDTHIRNTAKETSAIIDTTCSDMIEENTAFNEMMTSSTNSIDEETRNTKMSILELVRECGESTNVQMKIGKELITSVSTWIGDDCSKLMNIQRCMNETMSTARNSIKNQTLPFMINQSERNMTSLQNRCKKKEKKQ